MTATESRPGARRAGPGCSVVGGATTTLVLHATARGIDIEELSTELEGDMD